MDEATGRNVGGATVRGTVRPLADSISVEEAERSSRHVREAIAQQQRQLEELQRFSEENKSLSELVLELPDSVSHRIMVPFGKAAFFPGCLIHTNEFLVLLGESHYAERSAKQTVEILDRRSNFLDQKIAIVKDQIADLEAESSFVNNTAEEAKGGLVEIREEYGGSGQPQLNQSPTSRITAAAASSQTNSVCQVGMGSRFGASTSSNRNASADEDHEHELLMTRLSELELAETAAGEDNEESDEEVHEDSSVGIFEPFRSNLHRSEVSRNKNASVEEDYDSEETEEEDSQLSTSDDEDDNIEDAQRSSEDDEDDYEKSIQLPLEGRPLSRFAREVHAKEAVDSQHVYQNVTTQQGSPTESQSMVNRETRSRTLENPEANQGFNDLQKEGLQDRQRGVHQKDRHAKEIKNGGSLFSDHSRVPSLGKPIAAQLKAFSGIVTEHSSTEPATAINQQVEVKQSRPISRFKLGRVQEGKP